ncbi:hypothetical protein ABID21_001568 [Pseudorhizobium tarimense]|uniref:Uncharacterized protein n=1 Tax=Pseudorhizobium tarimense TaxID=1079109 RepID=A0ABV2H4U9_9HYPH|nr:hypothetical protein [Pseudorhizobium tarimense]MCJ8518683.1 hypothetical protein [Pseudorhizobium tarimense]
MPKKQKHRDEDAREQDAERPRLEKLRKTWSKASEEERAEFLRTLPRDQVMFFPQGEAPLVANGRYLLQSTKARVQRIMVKRNVRPDEIASEMGFSGEGTALARALIRDASLRLSMVRALALWLEEQERPSSINRVTRCR